MKIVIDRDSVCMGDDFGHQQTFECSEDETLESLMNKILQSKFFPAENIGLLVEKWEAKINDKVIFTYFPQKKQIKYIITKNSNIRNIEKFDLYFKATRKAFNYEKPKIKDYLLLILFFILIIICILIFVLPIYLLFILNNNNLDTCLDTGFCKKDMVINTENGKITIDKNTCLKYKWEWFEKDSACLLK